MKARALPSRKRLLELFRYDPKTGKLYFRIWTHGLSKKSVGKEAGFTREDGRRAIGISGHQFYRSRIVWKMLKGKEAKDGIDHKDRNPSNDRMQNLRPATQALNRRNSSMNSRNSSGYCGVTFHKTSGLWRARCNVNGVEYLGGYFKTKEEAAQVAARLRRKHHGKYAAHP
jgi:hypothetical protein